MDEITPQELKDASRSQRSSRARRRARGLGDQALPAGQRGPHPDRGARVPHRGAEPRRTTSSSTATTACAARPSPTICAGSASAGCGTSRAVSTRGRARSSRPCAATGPWVTVAETLLVERAGGVVRCTLDRPPLNLLEPGLIRALRDCFRDLAQDPSVRVAVLTGRGRAFTAGMDVHVLADLDVARAKALDHGTARGDPGRARGAVPGHRRRERPCARRGLRAGDRVRPARGRPGATFGLPEVRVGVPSVIEAALLRAAGRSRPRGRAAALRRVDRRRSGAHAGGS